MIQRFKQSLKLIRRLFSDSRYRVVFNSGLFDKEYYLRTYPDVKDKNIHPLIHYLDEGGAGQGRKPNPFFDPAFYLRKYPETEKDGLLPLLNYILYGWRENLQPSHLFCPEYYLSQIKSLVDPLTDPLGHFLQEGVKKGYRCSPYFDPEYYLTNNPDVKGSALDAYYHYLEKGAFEHRRPSRYFDSRWYLDRTPILREMSMDPVQHYVEYGISEGKSPNPLFDPKYYRANNQDTDEIIKDPFLHFLTIGLAQDRRPCPWFDPKFYRQRYSELLSSGLNPVEHYLHQGVGQGLYTEGKVESLKRKPLISLIVPVYNVASQYLNSCIRSVLFQSYPHWQLCLVDDCSSKQHIRPLLEQWAVTDERIKVSFLESNRGIVAASNAAATMATGEYFGFLDNDDELAPECLYEVASRICDTESDLIYTDEDLTGDDGRQHSIFRKPDFNKNLLQSHNYVTHFMVTAAAVFKEVGGFTQGTDGAQDYDLFLKLSERAGKIIHIPKILYHWRASATSTSINHRQKEYAEEAGRAALVAHMQRSGIDGEVRSTDLKFFYRCKKRIFADPTISIIVCYDRDEAPGPWIKKLLDSTSYPIKEIVVSVVGKNDNMLLKEAFPGNTPKIYWQYSQQEQGIGTIYNSCADRCTGDYFIFFHSDIAVVNANWIENMLEQAQTDGCGMVGPRIEIQNDGVCAVKTLPDLQETSLLYFKRFFAEASSHMNGLHCQQDVLAVSWDLAMIKRENFASINGYDHHNYGHYLGDLDACLRLHSGGFKNVYTPYCLAARKEYAKRFDERIWGNIWREEMSRFKKTWENLLKKGDPYYNIGLLDDNTIDIDEYFSWYA
jgi:glycosyltransferase involved in cell wall biosynthesis